MSENVERFKNYYGMNNTIKNLYDKSGKRHNNLFRLVLKENNIKLAYKKVSLNVSKNTAGPDGITLNEIKRMDFNDVIKEVKKRLHLKKKPSGRKATIIDNNKKVKTVSIINIFDKIAQQCILNILEPICESLFYPSNFGFRPNLKPQHCIATFNNSMWACIHQGYEYTVIKSDLVKCFDNIHIDRALNSLRMDFNIHDKKFLECIKGLMIIKHGKEIYDSLGLLQGSILGPILCNCVMHSLDKYMSEISVDNINYKRMVKGGRRDYRKMSYDKFRRKYENCYMIRYVRYADDFLIGCSYKEDAPVILDLVKNFLYDNLGLELNIKKTSIETLSKFGNNSIDFLGYKIKTTNGHIRISPEDFNSLTSDIRNKSKKILYKMSRGKENNIYELNSMLSGYINYYDICTNLEPLISYCNNILYKIGYKKLKVLDKENNKDIYIGKRENRGRRSIINLYELRKSTNLSYKDYIKIPYWKPSSDNEFMWINQLPSYRESFKNIYLHGLLIKYPKDYITGIEFKKILYIDIHHKIPVNLGGLDYFDNLIPLSKYSHILVHCKKENIKKYYNPNIKHSIIKLNKLRKLANNETINAEDLKTNTI